MIWIEKKIHLCQSSNPKLDENQNAAVPSFIPIFFFSLIGRIQNRTQTQTHFISMCMYVCVSTTPRSKPRIKNTERKKIPQTIYEIAVKEMNNKE